MPESRTRAEIEIKPDNPGRLTLRQPDRERVLPLAAMKPEELQGLANELCARGYEVAIESVDIEAPARGLMPEGVFHELRFAPPFTAYEQALWRARGELPA